MRLLKATLVVSIISPQITNKSTQLINGENYSVTNISCDLITIYRIIIYNKLGISQADLDRKKRVLESTLNENTVKIEECEKGSALLAENNKKLTAELENFLQVTIHFFLV